MIRKLTAALVISIGMTSPTFADEAPLTDSEAKACSIKLRALASFAKKNNSLSPPFTEANLNSAAMRIDTFRLMKREPTQSNLDDLIDGLYSEYRLPTSQLIVAWFAEPQSMLLSAEEIQTCMHKAEALEAPPF